MDGFNVHYIIPMHSKLCKIALWYECTRKIWMDNYFGHILDIPHIQTNLNNVMIASCFCDHNCKISRQPSPFTMWGISGGGGGHI